MKRNIVLHRITGCIESYDNVVRNKRVICKFYVQTVPEFKRPRRNTDGWKKGGGGGRETLTISIFVCETKNYLINKPLSWFEKHIHILLLYIRIWKLLILLHMKVPQNIQVKGKAVPLQAWTGPEGSSRLRPPDFIYNRHMKVVTSAVRTGRLYPSGNIPGTHFC
jgi:hypothetical protein